MKGRRLNSRSNSRPMIGFVLGAHITSQYRPANIIQASIDHRSNNDSQDYGCQHCELGPIIDPIILFFMAPKTKMCIFRDGFAKSSARDEKWIQCTECLVWPHVKCLDAETDIFLWILQINISFEHFVWFFSRCPFLYPNAFLYHFWCIFKNWKKKKMINWNSKWKKDVYNVRRNRQTML